MEGVYKVFACVYYEKSSTAGFENAGRYVELVYKDFHFGDLNSVALTSTRSPITSLL